MQLNWNLDSRTVGKTSQRIVELQSIPSHSSTEGEPPPFGLRTLVRIKNLGPSKVQLTWNLGLQELDPGHETVGVIWSGNVSLSVTDHGHATGVVEIE